ncbi:MAG: endonuclease [Candidatus Micrarchaeota archaeon]
MNVPSLYSALKKRYSVGSWWPAETPFEVVIGAVLTQQASWKNVEKAIANLKRAKLITARAISRAPLSKLEKCVRSTGFYKQKARRLKGIAKALARANLSKMELKEARAFLFSLHGVGPETADSILLYAYNKPIFPIDAYTKRVCKRAKIAHTLNYEKLRAFFERELPRSADIYKETHGMLVELAKEFCRVKPRCRECALKRMCKRASEPK